MTSLLVAAGQAVPTNGDPVANVALAADLTRRAGARGVRLLVLPEAFLTGYDWAAFDRVRETGQPRVETLEELTAPLRAAAVEAGCTVLVCTPLLRGDDMRLTTLVVRPDGTVEAAYDKQHVDRLELSWFTPGPRGPVVLDVEGVKVAPAICYDSRFPEHAAAAAAAGAQVYAVSTAYLEGSTRGRAVSLPARALDNGMFVVAGAALGTCGDRPITGGSCVLDPEGHELAALGTEPGLAVAELDLDLLAEVRARQTMHADRLG
ncbi:MAG: carbon-nitrogen hydrolase family protein [Nocardioides sp.]|nr:carbon-nitrogen hydrolase family protein [Nocardioides sp.]